MPAIRHLRQLEAAIEKRGIDSGSAYQLAFETGWTTYERGAQPHAPWSYTLEQRELFRDGYKAAAEVVGPVRKPPKPPAPQLRDLKEGEISDGAEIAPLEATVPCQRPVLPPFALFELAKAALTGYLSSRRVISRKDLAISCWRDADAVLAAMDGRKSET